MADINQNLKRANDGPLGQHLDANDQLVITGENNPHPTKDKDAHARLDAIEQALGGTLNTQLTGSFAILKGEAQPTGQQNDTLIEYDETTGDSIVYKYISGAWREL